MQLMPQVRPLQRNVHDAPGAHVNVHIALPGQLTSHVEPASQVAVVCVALLSKEQSAFMAHVWLQAAMLSQVARHLV